MKPCLSIPGGRLRPARPDDLDNLLALLHDGAVRRYLCDDTILARETVAEMLARSNRLDPQGFGLWVIEDRREDARDDFAGIAGLEPVPTEVGAAPDMAGGVEPIIALDPKVWGKGLAGEALDALILHANESLGLSRLVGAVDRPNARSHRLMQRCGFTVMGRTPGPAYELVLYELRLGEAEAG